MTRLRACERFFRLWRTRNDCPSSTGGLPALITRGRSRTSVLPVTYAQLTTEERVVALSRAVADKRGVAWRPPTERERELGRRMRSEVLCDWSTLPDV